MSKDQGSDELPESEATDPDLNEAVSEVPDAGASNGTDPLEAETANASIDDGAHELAKRRYLVRRFWHSAKGFWGRSGDRLAWPLSGAVLALILLNLAAQYGINVWNRIIFDALEARDAGTVFLLSAAFVPLAAASVLCGVANVYGRMSVQRRWRA
jgi:putative ATP-binding cassette transporter